MNTSIPQTVILYFHAIDRIQCIKLSHLLRRDLHIINFIVLSMSIFVNKEVTTQSIIKVVNICFKVAYLALLLKLFFHV